MQNGGHLIIATRLRDVTSAECSELQIEPGSFIVVSVSDTGVGIPADFLSRVTEPFFTTKTAGEGSGLGLSMVHGFVLQSGGAMKIESEPAMGTTISLLFPAVLEPPLDFVGASSTKSTTPAVGTETILVVDDDARVRRFATRTLTDLGYRVFQAEDSAKALEILDGGVIVDAMFSDVVMPGTMDGYRLADLVSERHPEVKTLLTTGFSGDQKDSDGFVDRNRHQPLLRKPYTKIQLATEIRRVIDDVSA